MDNINIKVLLEKGENRLVKIRNCFNSETVITLSAFANTSGGRIIIDSGKCPDDKSLAAMTEEWLSEIRKRTNPELPVNIYTEKIEFKTYILLSVCESYGNPVYCDEMYYFRKQDSDIKMNLNEIINLFNT